MVDTLTQLKSLLAFASYKENIHSFMHKYLLINIYASIFTCITKKEKKIYGYRVPVGTDR